jgi:hypothetical protein
MVGPAQQQKENIELKRINTWRPILILFLKKAVELHGYRKGGLGQHHLLSKPHLHSLSGVFV